MSGRWSVEELLALPQEDLLDRLGAELVGGSLGFGVEDPDRQRRFARRWLDERWEEIRAQVCGDPRTKELVEGGSGDALRDAAAVIDVLMVHWGHPTAMILAVIVLRRGLSTLCA